MLIMCGGDFLSKAEYDNFGEKLAFHTAPTLLGIKCASLVSLSSAEFDLDFHTQYFNRRAAAKGLKSSILCSCNNRALMLVYSERLLNKRLSDSGIFLIKSYLMLTTKYVQIYKYFKTA